MNCAMKLFCLLVAVTSVRSAAISGGLGLTRNGASINGAIQFPSIPGINAPLSSIFPSRSSGSSSSGSSPISNILDLFNIPSAASLLPTLSSSNSSGLTIPSLSLPNITALAQIPGLNIAIQSARRHVEAALNLTNGITTGIEQAISEALDSNDPTAAVRTILQTIINSYVTVAANCPLLIVGNAVIQEGVSLAAEVARGVLGSIFGNGTTTTT